MRKISTSTTPSNLVINKFPNREVYEKIKAKGSLGEDDVNVLEDYGYTLTETDKTEIAGKVIADGTEFTLSEFPTALKNPAALTFAGAVTGTYDGSEELTITIPEGGSGGSSGGGLRKMSAVASYIGIPAAELDGAHEYDYTGGRCIRPTGRAAGGLARIMHPDRGREQTCIP